jgi:hypothetical protein
MSVKFQLKLWRQLPAGYLLDFNFVCGVFSSFFYGFLLGVLAFTRILVLYYVSVQLARNTYCVPFSICIFSGAEQIPLLESQVSEDDFSDLSVVSPSAAPTVRAETITTHRPERGRRLHAIMLSKSDSRVIWNQAWRQNRRQHYLLSLHCPSISSP